MVIKIMIIARVTLGRITGSKNHYMVLICMHADFVDGVWEREEEEERQRGWEREI